MTVKGVVKAMATKSAWGQVRHCDNYLRGELKEQKEAGTQKTEQGIYDALNCERDNFTKTCMLYMKQYGQKKVKGYEYVQSFSPEDRKNGLTPEKAHAIGIEFARRYFAEYPCLIVTHIDTEHIHNQMLIGNVNVDTGKCLKVNAKILEDMKKFTGMQCVRDGFIFSVYEKNGMRKEPWKEKSNSEYLMESKGKVTDKMSIAFVTREILKEAMSMEDFIQKLFKQYKISVRMTANSISFSHPDMKRAVRGERLGADLAKGEIEHTIKYNQQRRNREQQGYEVFRTITYSEERAERAREDINSRFGERESSWSDPFIGQREQETGIDAERVRASTSKPSEAVRSITETVRRNSVEAREKFRKLLTQLTDSRRGLHRELNDARNELSRAEERRKRLDEEIAHLTREQNRLARAVQQHNKGYAGRRSNGMER